MDDTISRGEAIEALERAKQNIRHNIERAIGEAICEILDEVESGIKQLPSATDKNVGTKLGTDLAQLGTDCISRQSAIDVVSKWFEKIGLNGDICLDGLRQLPSAEPLEDIHREKEQAYYCGYEDGKAAQWDWLKTEIKRMKMTYTICINHDYYTGYMSALSAVEGCIAQLEGDTE